MSKGIIIAVPKKYEKTCLSNLINLRNLNCHLPIEIWEIGNEISNEIKAEFEKIENIHFKNVNNYTKKSSHWKGFQVKAFILKFTTFKEVILLDADVIVHQNPELLLTDKNYIKTGTYFFKDLDKWQFHKLTNKFEQFKQQISYNKFTSASFFNKRKNWLREILPKKKPIFPSEWDYIYSVEIPKEPVKEALQESGVVYINKEKHPDTIENIYTLNKNHKETYQYLWGDKETFWIACVMTNKEYYFNPTSGYMSKETKRLSHDYNGKLFFSQKG